MARFGGVVDRRRSVRREVGKYWIRNCLEYDSMKGLGLVISCECFFTCASNRVLG
jgi:hypothetical protein